MKDICTALLLPLARVILSIIQSTILPRNGSTDVLSKVDTMLLYCLLTLRRVNLPALILFFMSHTVRNKRSALPYAMAITKLLRHLNYDFSGDRYFFPKNNEFSSLSLAQLTRPKTKTKTITTSSKRKINLVVEDPVKPQQKKGRKKKKIDSIEPTPSSQCQTPPPIQTLPPTPSPQRPPSPSLQPLLDAALLLQQELNKPVSEDKKGKKKQRAKLPIKRKSAGIVISEGVVTTAEEEETEEEAVVPLKRVYKRMRLNKALQEEKAHNMKQGEGPSVIAPAQISEEPEVEFSPSEFCISVDATETTLPESAPQIASEPNAEPEPVSEPASELPSISQTIIELAPQNLSITPFVRAFCITLDAVMSQLPEVCPFSFRISPRTIFSTNRETWLRVFLPNHVLVPVEQPLLLTYPTPQEIVPVAPEQEEEPRLLQNGEQPRILQDQAPTTNEILLMILEEMRGLRRDVNRLLRAQNMNQ